MRNRLKRHVVHYFTVNTKRATSDGVRRIRRHKMAEHPEQKTHYQSTDKASQSNQAEYENMIDSINQAMDPNSNTVLVVDDETPIRKFVSRQIRKSSTGVVIFEAENGQDALEKLEIIRDKYHNDPVLIITDLNMPVMDGWELIDELKKDYESRGETSGIPIVVLSSTSGEKGIVFKKSAHSGKSKYEPIISIAKETCMDAGKFDAKGEKGLTRWLKHLMKNA